MNTYLELLNKKAELDRQAAELDRQLRDARNAERTQVIAQVKALMTDHGLTVADLGVGGGYGRRGGALPTRVGVKVAPKYRNAQTGETWSGRGLKPKWIQVALSQGKTLEDFAL